MNKTLLAATLCSISLLPAQALAQHAKYPNPNVTIYSLDDPATPLYNSYQGAGDPNYASPEPSPANAGAGFLGAEWSGRINAGASKQTGNTDSAAFNADTTIKGKWGDTHRATIKAEYNRESEDDTTVENNKMIEGEYDYFFRPKWFFDTSLSFEQDDISDIDLRTTAGIGLGHQPYESEELNLQYILGPSYLREDYEDGGSEDSIAIEWSLDYDQKIWDEAMQLFHEHELLAPVEEENVFLLDSKTGLRVPLKKGLVATGEVDFEWDSDPEPGVDEKDVTYSAKIGYEW